MNETVLSDRYEPVDLCALYEPVILPPAELLAEWAEYPPYPGDPFHETIERRIGGTRYLIETVCSGNEALADKAKRLIFSEKAVKCS